MPIYYNHLPQPHSDFNDDSPLVALVELGLLFTAGRLSRAVDVQMPSRVGRERPNAPAHILRTTARQTRTPAKLSAVLVGAVHALSLGLMSIASDAIDSQQIA